MWPARTDLLPTTGAANRLDNTTPSPAQAFPHHFDQQLISPITTPLSPPPVSRGPKLKSQNSHSRLRSGSGLAFHTNQAAFRRFTDYNSDGSVPSRLAHAGMSRVDVDSSAEDLLARTVSHGYKASVSSSKVLLEFFDSAVITLALTNPATEQRLRKLTETNHGAADEEFLRKVGFTVSAHPYRQGRPC